MDDKKEAKRQYLRQWRESHPNYFKQWRESHLSYMEQWRKAHTNYYREFQQGVKVKVLTYYGNGKCACVQCGESRMACLSIDHIIAIGKAKRNQNGGTGTRLYRWLITHGYPSGYQTLCMNCQWVKRALNNETRLNK